MRAAAQCCAHAAPCDAMLRRVAARLHPPRLRELEADGILTRTVHAQVPPRVDYALTARGTSLLPVIRAMSRWGHADMEAAQLAPDKTV